VSGEPAAASVAETHLSTVFLVGDRAYKLPKPKRFDFVDLSTVEARRIACEREVAVNRRIAPDVYEGVATLSGPEGEPWEHLVVMRRMPSERSLERLLGTDADVSSCVRAVARTIAAFHERAERSSAISRQGSPEALWRAWQENAAELRTVVRALGHESIQLVDDTDALGQRYLSGRARLFERRVAEGHVRDGHGDLLAEDIYCLEDGPRILDALAFRDDFRAVDVVSDVAFLVMDLERLGRPELARTLLADYREFTGETSPASLADHYAAFRALIRAKVACLRHEQGGAEAAAEARSLVRLAHAHEAQGRVRLVLVGGLPGTGSTTVASGLAEETESVLLRSDVIRRELARDGSPRYDASAKDAVYEEMLRRAGELLGAGECVVLDASWTLARHRDRARETADAAMADLVALRTDAPIEVAADRIGARLASGDDASEATPAIAAELAHDAEPWPEATAVDTTRPAPEAVATALERFGPVPGGPVSPA